MENLLFIIFSFSAILCGFLVISSTNPVHSIFALVLAFANSCLLLLLLGVEFLGFLLMIVYVGAIAILFLFVVMMLNIRLVELIDNSTRYVPVGLLIGIIFILQLLIIQESIIGGSSDISIINQLWINAQSELNEYYGSIDKIYNWTNTTLLGNYLYTHGIIYFLISGLILLISMIGAIVLTLHHESGIKRQDIFAQVEAETELLKYTAINMKSQSTN